jgi:RimJ/RimL family protein N-acetyltransferase
MPSSAPGTVFAHVPALRDDRLALRPLTAGDAAAVAAAVPAGEPGAWEPKPGPYTVPQARRIVEEWEDGRRRGVRLALGVFEGASAEFVGSVVLQRGTPDEPVTGRGDALEVAYWITPEARRRGLAGRALGLVSAWALTLPGIGRLWLEVDPGNVVSRRLAEKAGYELRRRIDTAGAVEWPAGYRLIFELTAGRPAPG